MSRALVFPGQGAQEPGMGVGLLEPGAPAHDLAVEASDLTGLDLVRLATTAAADEIRATEVAQPLILLHSVALLRTLPDAVASSVAIVAGHSLGEYSALVASGALGWQETLALVRARGLAMAGAAGPGQGMSAVLGLDGEVVAQALADSGAGGAVVVANDNAPGQVVVSGDLEELGRAAEALKAAGAKRIIPLQVGGAFHSPLMAPAAAELEGALAQAPLQPGRPQAFNVDGGVRTEPDEIREALRRQLVAPVRWVACVRSIVAAAVNEVIELGVGTTLTGLGKRIAPELDWRSVSTPEALVAG